MVSIWFVVSETQIVILIPILSYLKNEKLTYNV